MFTIYNLLKFLHVAGAIIWIGGACALGLLNLRLTRSQNPAAVADLSLQSAAIGGAILGPAAWLTLLAGIFTAAQAGLNFGSLWIVWGFAGVLLSILIGAIFVRRATGDLHRLAANAHASALDMKKLQQRLATWTVINLIVLFSSVWAMVFKPIL